MVSAQVLSLVSPTKVHVRCDSSIRPSEAPVLTSTLFQNQVEFRTLLRNSRSFAPKLARTNNRPLPVSSLPLQRSSPSSRENFVQVFARKAAVFLVGSFVFLGLCSCKPGLALPSATVRSETEYEEEEMFEKVLEREPNNMEAMKVVVYGKMRRGKTAEAVKYIKKLKRIQPQETEWKLLEALCYEMMGQLTKAKRLFSDVLKENPLLIRALHGLAMVMHKSHEGSAVFDMLNEALEVARQEQRVTEERNIQVLIGQMHIVMGQLEAGLKIFREMVDENPRDFRPYLCQGIIYSLMDKEEEAEQQFEIYWSLVPEEFPERGFLDDVAMAAQAKSRERLQNSFRAKSAYGN
ncbi:PREDICTED: protein SLOW GREEN 1, chloroplastic [Tarenaya hassleriana]|uniref:protein SLOW GREEN 1, chloroplastic n=1 Tax=Tarenaya hassleriana TaxID=28532 RepID=UPI00053C56E3|nr:PREDICTED: protein SLOW GREEN 1, chloroplastic [Tarenaya hassleriana]XP_010555329.1 PREDICTED: protein SLOW GREEN 1, chloroplastic [Tarenaya hassleriana]